MRASGTRLAVIRDGVELPEEQARALWRAFSEHMERNVGDLAGFAKAHGYILVRPEQRRSRAVLIFESAGARAPEQGRPLKRAVPGVVRASSTRENDTASERKERRSAGQGRGRS